MAQPHLSPTGDERTTSAKAASYVVVFIPYGGRTNAEVVIALVAVPIYPLLGTKQTIYDTILRYDLLFIPYGGRTNFQ